MRYQEAMEDLLDQMESSLGKSLNSLGCEPSRVDEFVLALLIQDHEGESELSNS